MNPIFLPGLAMLLSLTGATLAQENQELGRMWTFENPPLAYLEKEYGFKPDQEWLDSLRLGSLRLGGEDVLSGFYSASFVVDGNIESLHADFVFRDDVPRAVSVHVDGIMEALVKIYDAHRVAKELTGN